MTTYMIRFWLGIDGRTAEPYGLICEAEQESPEKDTAMALANALNEYVENYDEQFYLVTIEEA